MNAETKLTLADRVLQFQFMELPGQPMMMHMGTSYLVNDLWSAHKDMAEALREIAGIVSASKSSSDNDRLYAALGTLDKAREIARAALLKAGG